MSLEGRGLEPARGLCRKPHGGCKPRRMDPVLWREGKGLGGEGDSPDVCCAVLPWVRPLVVLLSLTPVGDLALGLNVN